MIDDLVRIAIRMDELTQYDLADQVDGMIRSAVRNPLYDPNPWRTANGIQVERIRKDVVEAIKRSGANVVDPEIFAKEMRRRYQVTISPEETAQLIQDESVRLKAKKTNPWVDRVGEFVLDGGFTVEDIEEYTGGKLMGDEIVDLWKQFVRAHPEVRRNLLKRRDIVHARPSADTKRKSIGDETEGLRHDIGEASGDPKVQMRSHEDLDYAAIETYRLSLQPRFQRPDGSPNVEMLAKVIGGSEHRIKRQLERARKLTKNLPTLRPPRSVDDRNAARDMISELAAKGADHIQLLRSLNEMSLPGEFLWTDNDMWNLFHYRDQRGRERVVPINQWPNYREIVKTTPETSPISAPGDS